MKSSHIKKDDFFSTLIKTHQQKIFNLTYSLLRNVEDAKDATQETFFKAYRSLDNFRGEAEYSTWLYRIAYNTCLSMIKKRNPCIDLFSEEASNEYETTLQKGVIFHIEDRRNLADFKAEQNNLRDLIWHALDQITPLQRTAFLLHHYDGFTYEEIAQILNKSISSIESLIFRAKQNLQLLLRDIYKQFMEQKKNFSNTSK